MFFSDDLLTNKKGSFGIIWLMATLGPRNKKITRKQLTAVDLAKTCDLIAEPTEPMALRLSGALLVGVARVYNQNYEIFYSDVSNFHSNVRRSIATDFTTMGTGSGGTASLDLPGGGKSKIDQITFSNREYDIEDAMDFNLSHIDWNDPFATRNKRRHSSALSSQDPQSSQHDSEDEEGSEDEEEGSDDDGVITGRDGRSKKLISSPFAAAYGSTTKTRMSIHHPSERISPGRAFGVPVKDFEGEVDLGLDLDVDNGVGNDSFSGPSGRGFELPAGEEGRDVQMDIQLGSRHATPAPKDARPPSQAGVTSSKQKQTEHEGSEGGSIENVEDELVGIKKRARKVKRAALDEEIELDEKQDREARRKYRSTMERERHVINARATEKKIEARVDMLVNNAGGLQFYDPVMSAIFSDFTKVDFKWEAEVTARKRGANLEPPKEADGIDPTYPGDVDPLGPRAGQMGDIAFGAEAGYQDVFQDYEIPIHEVSDSVRQRPGSEGPDMEIARRASQGNQAPLPWEERAREVTPGVGRHSEGFDSDFSAATLRLSVMTPQELKLRGRSHTGSHTGKPGSERRQRHRSGSLISNRADDDPLLLAPGNDLELPQDEEAELSMPPMAASQQARLDKLPAAFKPPMLATLEIQCREFFTYLEKKTIILDTNVLSFDEVVPEDPPTTKRVAATGFYNILTLTTKKLVAVNQEEAWGPIEVRFAVDMS
ncbi:hypothetical protein I317_01657 [Kwoniella heveanensis CBS 569]|nr:hypothetical protein I317_01657 [Kwoniella heveanensis CBS 569]